MCEAPEWLTPVIDRVRLIVVHFIDITPELLEEAEWLTITGLLRVVYICSFIRFNLCFSLKV